MRHAKIKRRNGNVKSRGGRLSQRFSVSYFTLTIVALTLLAPTESACSADDAAIWHVGLEFAWVDPSGDFGTTTVDGNTFGTSYDSGFGGGLRGEYQFSDRFGVELSMLSAGSVELSSGNSEGNFGSSVTVSAFTPVMLGLNVHLTPDGPVDVYAGPLLALVRYSDVEFIAAMGTASASVSIEDDVGWGAIVGIEVPLGSRGWLVQGNLRYIDTDLKDSVGVFSIDSDFDPLILSIGVGYRF
jgi:outer membrane protein W